MKDMMIITIDGPAASGKSTVARLLAARLGYYYIASGLLYRGLAFALLKKGYIENTISHPRAADIEALFHGNHFEYRYSAELHEQLYFDGGDITSYLRAENISHCASLLAVNKEVRIAIEQWQYAIAKHHNCVIEGRDTGSVVFPYAYIKFFLTASLEARAKRWQKDSANTGPRITLEQAKARILERDERDRTRTYSPLCQPHDAVVIDNSDAFPEEVVERMRQEIAKKRGS